MRRLKQTLLAVVLLLAALWPRSTHAATGNVWYGCTLHLDYATMTHVVKRECMTYAMPRERRTRTGWIIRRTRVSPHVLHSVRFPRFYVAPPAVDMSATAVPCAWQWRGYIAPASRAYGVPTRVIAAVICVESYGSQYANSCSYGTDSYCSKGLMQLLDTTCASVVYGSAAWTYVSLCASRLYEPAFNIAAGAKYLLMQYRAFGYSWSNAAGAYNAGSYVNGIYVAKFLHYYD